MNVKKNESNSETPKGKNWNDLKKKDIFETEMDNSNWILDGSWGFSSSMLIPTMIPMNITETPTHVVLPEDQFITQVNQSQGKNSSSSNKMTNEHW